MANQIHKGTGDNVAGDQTKIDRQINQGANSIYNEYRNINIGLMPGEINQIVATLIGQHQLDSQVKDQQIKDLTAAVIALSKGKDKDALESLARGDLDKAKDFFAKESARSEMDSACKEEAFRNLGALAFLDNTDESLFAYSEAVKINPLNANTWNHLGGLFQRIGNIDEAIYSYKMVLALGETTNNVEEMAWGYGNLGVIYTALHDLNNAEEFIKKALAIDESLGNKEGIAAGYGNLGTIHLNRGDHDQAIEAYQKALVIDESLGNKVGMSKAYGGLGNCHYALHDFDKAIDNYEKSLLLATDLKNKESLAKGYGNLANVYYSRGDLAKSIELHQQALVIDEALGRKEGMAIEHGNLGAIYAQLGNIEQAKQAYSNSIELFKLIGDPARVKVVEGLLAKLNYLSDN